MRKNNKSRLFSSLFFCSVLLYVFIGTFEYFILINFYSKKIKAVVIDKKEFFGNNPVTKAFAYSYAFYVDGKMYTKSTGNRDYKIGDTLPIRYLPIDPSVSEIVSPKKE